MDLKFNVFMITTIPKFTYSFNVIFIKIQLPFFVFHKFTVWPQNWYGNTGDPEQSKQSWKTAKLEYSQFPMQNWPQCCNNQECMTILAQGDDSQLNRIESRNIPLHFIFKVPTVLNVGSIAFNTVLQ